MSRTPDEARRAEVLDRAVDYVLAHGLAELSLRPLAKAVGSSPRVLLYYFGSMANMKLTSGLSPREITRALWRQYSDPKWEPLMRLFFEVYALALQDRARFP